jgi:hypothetical protein
LEAIVTGGADLAACQLSYHQSPEKIPPVLWRYIQSGIPNQLRQLAYPG